MVCLTASVEVSHLALLSTTLEVALAREGPQDACKGDISPSDGPGTNWKRLGGTLGVSFLTATLLGRVAVEASAWGWEVPSGWSIWMAPPKGVHSDSIQLSTNSSTLQEGQNTLPSLLKSSLPFNLVDLHQRMEKSGS